jgi:co-chaperonin GroES (HSP10)
MDAQEARKVITSSEAHRLKALGYGVTVKRVIGKRLLIKPIDVWTELDEWERKGLALPEGVKKEQQPLSQMGEVVQLGTDPECADYVEGQFVMFSKFSGIDLKLNAVGFRIITLEEVVAELDIEHTTIVKEDERHSIPEVFKS